ncbi:MAG TPA: S-adenosylmethionine:tRNA ribosyltransferase-isomerase, partial [Acidimicrobiales bacterium]
MAEFDYALPAERIAQQPLAERDAARLLVDRGPGNPPQHRHVRDLPDLLRPDDVIVVNDTRVIPARLVLQRSSGGAAEVLLLEPLDPVMRCWEALVKPGRKLRIGERLHDEGEREVVRVGERRTDGTRAVELIADDPLALLDELGRMPLPPYITAPLTDPERYQTVFARNPGSAAAPTAGLHLTPAVLDALAARGIERNHVELVVGLDTFRPVTVDDAAHHHMHSERYRVPLAVWEACTEA